MKNREKMGRCRASVSDRPGRYGVCCMQISELMLKAIRTVHQDAVIIIKTGSFYNVYGVENINKYLLKNLNNNKRKDEEYGKNNVETRNIYISNSGSYGFLWEHGKIKYYNSCMDRNIKYKSSNVLYFCKTRKIFI